ncbi:MAG TPA: PRC-barrel domain-containing protein [Gammaproteobacteria bacterium]|nr:PRC-barrel domain-containing protein [Gammaproteobacteria bacterium]
MDKRTLLTATVAVFTMAASAASWAVQPGVPAGATAGVRSGVATQTQLPSSPVPAGAATSATLETRGQSRSNGTFVETDASGLQAVSPGSATGSVAPKAYIGKEVVTAEGQAVGKVEKLAIHKQDHRVYAVIGMGGFLGIGEKNAAVPVNQLQPQGPQKLGLKAGISKKALEDAMPYESSEFSAFEVSGRSSS